MTANNTYYTRNNDEIKSQFTPILNGRNQLDYDYDGALNVEDDPADQYDYRVVKAVRIA